MPRWRRRHRANRTQLVERKRQLEGEINLLTAELRRRAARGLPTADVDAQLAAARSRHYQLRLEIDQAGPPA